MNDQSLFWRVNIYGDTGNYFNLFIEWRFALKIYFRNTSVVLEKV